MKKSDLYFFLQRKLGCELAPPPRHTAFSQTFTPRTYGGIRQRRADDSNRVEAAGDRVAAGTDRVAAGTDRVAAGTDPLSSNRADCVPKEYLARWV
jgi:hypothetical protein